MRSCGYGYSCGSDFESYSLHAWLRCFSLPRGANSTAVTELDRLTFLHHEMETMTIHQNRPKDQYRHAPLNGLIIGAVAEVAWAVEFLLPFLFPLGNYSRNVRMALISLVLPVIGWITGVLGADSPQLYHASKEERQSQDNRRRHGGYNRNIISNHLLYFCCRYRHFLCTR